MALSEQTRPGYSVLWSKTGGRTGREKHVKQKRQASELVRKNSSKDPKDQGKNQNIEWSLESGASWRQHLDRVHIMMV